MKKLAVTTALALVLAGSAYAQGHDHGGGGSFGGGGAAVSAHGSGGGAAFSGGGHVSGGGGQPTMSHGPSGTSSFGGNGRMPSSSFNGRGTTSGSQFSRTDRGSEGRTVYNQEHGNRTLYNRYHDQDRGHENFGRDRGHERFGRDRDFERFGRDRGRDIDIGHRGVVRGNFFEHGRRFGFRRFWHNEWVYLTDWDSCTAWAWVHVAPGVWTWRPIDVCVG